MCFTTDLQSNDATSLSPALPMGIADVVFPLRNIVWGAVICSWRLFVPV